MRSLILLGTTVLAGLFAGAVMAANGDGGRGPGAVAAPGGGASVTSGGGQTAPALIEILGDQDRLRDRDQDQLKDQHLDQLKDQDQTRLQEQDRLHQDTKQ